MQTLAQSTIGESAGEKRKSNDQGPQNKKKKNEESVTPAMLPAAHSLNFYLSAALPLSTQDSVHSPATITANSISLRQEPARSTPLSINSASANSENVGDLTSSQSQGSAVFFDQESSSSDLPHFNWSSVVIPHTKVAANQPTTFATASNNLPKHHALRMPQQISSLPASSLSAGESASSQPHGVADKFR